MTPTGILSPRIEGPLVRTPATGLEIRFFQNCNIGDRGFNCQDIFLITPFLFLESLTIQNLVLK